MYGVTVGHVVEIGPTFPGTTVNPPEGQLILEGTGQNGEVGDVISPCAEIKFP